METRTGERGRVQYGSLNTQVCMARDESSLVGLLSPRASPSGYVRTLLTFSLGPLPQPKTPIKQARAEEIRVYEYVYVYGKNRREYLSSYSYTYSYTPISLYLFTRSCR